MKLYHVILLVFFSFLSTQSVFTADKLPGKAKRNFRKGKCYLKKGDFSRAIPFLKESVNLNPEEAKYPWYLGRALYESDKVAESLSALTRAYNLDQKVDPKIDLYLGMALHRNNEFEEAVIHYQDYLASLNPDDPMSESVRTYIQQAKSGPDIINHPKKYEIKNLGEFVNTRFPEYSATYNQDYSYMIYTTRRPRTTRQVAFSRYHYENINEEVYQSTLTDDVWMKSYIFPKPIPRWNHDASISLSRDGKTLIYYVDQHFGDVFISELQENGKWSKRVSIGDRINTKKYNEPSVYISKDGQLLYYVSDKPGGQGKKDLYLSKKLEDGTWGEGENMGPMFNTSTDEDAPFLSEDEKTLYFSSRGHNSMGGYDIFKSTKLPDGSWSAPENMGYPLNSAADDIYFVLRDDSERFFFSSDRPGGFGEKDLYGGGPSISEPVECGETPVAGTVRDEKTGDPISAEFKLLDPDDMSIISTFQSDPKTGKYGFSIPDCGKEYLLDLNVNAEPQIVSGELPPGNTNVLSGIIKDDLTGKTLRAAVELVDPKTGKVIASAYSNPETGYYYLPVQSGRKYQFRVKSNDYLSYLEDFVLAPTENIAVQKNIVGLQRHQEEPGKIVIGWQFFDHDRFILKKMYSEDIDNLVSVMTQVPQISLKIVGHTDGDGTNEYNKVLSERRAASVKDFLISKGIDEKRLVVSGMGEEQPLYPNTTDLQKKWNRRVEIYIIN